MLNTLGEVITCVVAIAAVVLVPAGIIRAWFPVIRERVASMIMLRSQNAPISFDPVSAPVASTSTNNEQLIATPGNADNGKLPGNAVADLVPSEARDIIRMQAKAEAVVTLLKSAKMTNKAEAIELIFDCSRSGRSNSTYQQAVTLVDQLTERYPHRTPDQEQSRAGLGLSVR